MLKENNQILFSLSTTEDNNNIQRFGMSCFQQQIIIGGRLGMFVTATKLFLLSPKRKYGIRRNEITRLTGKSNVRGCLTRQFIHPTVYIIRV